MPPAPIDVLIEGSHATVRLPSRLTRREAPRLYEVARKLGRRRAIQEVELDFGAVVDLDSAGGVTARIGKRLLEEAGKTCRYENVADRHRAAFDMVPVATGSPKSRRRATGFVEAVGDRGVRAGRALTDLAEVVVDTVRGVPACTVGRERRRMDAVAEQAVIIGVDALFLVSLLSFLIGVILAFQAEYQLARFGARSFMANIVALGMVREFSPLLTAIILAGRSGAAMAAEIGTMAVREELDALRTIGVTPTRFLVVPRMIAITVVQPVLTLFSMAVGLAAGVVAAKPLGLSPLAVYHGMAESLTAGDFWLGLSKSVLFAWVIGYTGCLMGLRTRGGAHSVGQNTTRAVVASVFFIVVVDSIVTTAWTVGRG